MIIIIITFHVLFIVGALLIYFTAPNNMYRDQILKNIGTVALYTGIVEIMYLVGGILDYVPLQESWGIPMEIGSFALLFFAVVAKAKKFQRMRTAAIFVISSTFVLLFGVGYMYLLTVNANLTFAISFVLLIPLIGIAISLSPTKSTKRAKKL